MGVPMACMDAFTKVGGPLEKEDVGCDAVVVVIGLLCELFVFFDQPRKHSSLHIFYLEKGQAVGALSPLLNQKPLSYALSK